MMGVLLWPKIASLLLILQASTCLGQNSIDDYEYNYDDTYYDYNDIKEDNNRKSDVGIFEAPTVRISGEVVSNVSQLKMEAVEESYFLTIFRTVTSISCNWWTRGGRSCCGRWQCWWCRCWPATLAGAATCAGIAPRTRSGVAARDHDAVIDFYL